MIVSSGTYTAQAVDGYLSYIKQKTEPVIRVKFSIIGGPQDGQSVEWTGFCGDSSFERTVQSLRYCGWMGTDISDLVGIDRNDVEIVVENYEHKGKTYARVKYVNQVGGGARMPVAEARAFAASVKDRIAKMTPTEPEPDGEVPF